MRGRPRRDAEPEDHLPVAPLLRRLAIINLAAAVGAVVGCFFGGLLGMVLASEAIIGLETAIGITALGTVVFTGLFVYMAWTVGR